MVAPCWGAGGHRPGPHPQNPEESCSPRLRGLGPSICPSLGGQGHGGYSSKGASVPARPRPFAGRWCPPPRADGVALAAAGRHHAATASGASAGGGGALASPGSAPATTSNELTLGPVRASEPTPRSPAPNHPRTLVSSRAAAIGRSPSTEAIASKVASTRDGVIEDQRPLRPAALRGAATLAGDARRKPRRRSARRQPETRVVIGAGPGTATTSGGRTQAAISSCLIRMPGIPASETRATRRPGYLSQPGSFAGLRVAVIRREGRDRSGPAAAGDAVLGGNQWTCAGCAAHGG